MCWDDVLFKLYFSVIVLIWSKFCIRTESYSLKEFQVSFGFDLIWRVKNKTDWFWNVSGMYFEKYIYNKTPLVFIFALLYLRAPFSVKVFPWKIGFFANMMKLWPKWDTERLRVFNFTTDSVSCSFESYSNRYLIKWCTGSPDINVPTKSTSLFFKVSSTFSNKLNFFFEEEKNSKW